MTAPDSGLSAAEAAARLARDGPNQLPHPDARRWPAILGDVVREPMLLLLAAVIWPFTASRGAVDVMTLALIYVILGLGLNIVVGFAGLLVLGYAAFYAVGAYTYALLAQNYHLSFWLSLPGAARIGVLRTDLMVDHVGTPATGAGGVEVSMERDHFPVVVHVLLGRVAQATGVGLRNGAVRGARIRDIELGQHLAQRISQRRRAVVCAFALGTWVSATAIAPGATPGESTMYGRSPPFPAAATTVIPKSDKS